MAAQERSDDNYWKRTQLQEDCTGGSVVFFAHRLAYDGLSFILIFGFCSCLGAFITIPDWAVGCNAYPDGDVDGNTSKMTAAGLDSAYARPLAEYIGQWIRQHQKAYIAECIKLLP